MKKILILYDIRDNKRLAHVAKIVEKFAVRAQKSVFEFEGNDRTIELLRKLVRSEMSEEDSVIFIDLCPKCWQKRLKMGVLDSWIDDGKSFRIL